MDKAEFLRLTNETHGQPTRWADFEHLIPGWGSKVAYPYNLPIEEGIQAEMERLRGSRYLVVVLHEEYDLDGLYEALFLDQGFSDPLEAVQHAHGVQEQHCQATLAEHTDWHPMGIPSSQWPSKEAAGPRLLRLPPQKFGDGTGFNSRRVYTAVLPVDPDHTLSATLFQILDKTTELHAFFRTKSGLGAY